MWPKAKRAVSDATAKQIADVARQHGIKAVGVFVDEDAATISDRYAALFFCAVCTAAHRGVSTTLQS